MLREEIRGKKKELINYLVRPTGVRVAAQQIREKRQCLHLRRHKVN